VIADEVMKHDHERKHRAHERQCVQMPWPCRPDCSRARFRSADSIGAAFGYEAVEPNHCIGEAVIFAAIDEGNLRQPNVRARPTLTGTRANLLVAAKFPRPRLGHSVVAARYPSCAGAGNDDARRSLWLLPSALERDREKCVAVFRKDHAQSRLKPRTGWQQDGNVAIAE
jgi:hypothetical protein